MFGEVGLRPVQVHHEGLQSLQLPEKVLGGGRALPAEEEEETSERHRNALSMLRR